MQINKVYMTNVAEHLIKTDTRFTQAYNEVINSICSSVWPVTSDIFTINNSLKNINGVVPIKERCYIMLEDTYNWFREKSLNVLKIEKQKGGPIDVYKEFHTEIDTMCVGLEFETGNISSAHRSMQKLMLGLNRKEINLAIILMPVHKMAYYLTDRVTNYEELEPYFENAGSNAFVFIGFNADAFDPHVDPIPKGSDGMSKRSIKKWINK